MSYPQDGTPANVTLGGALTIGNAAAHRETMLDAFRSGGDARIRIEAATEADLSFVQLLCSAHRTFAAAGRDLSIEGSLPGSLRRVAEDSGIGRFSCGSNDKDCVWKREGA